MSNNANNNTDTMSYRLIEETMLHSFKKILIRKGKTSDEIKNILHDHNENIKECIMFMYDEFDLNDELDSIEICIEEEWTYKYTKHFTKHFDKFNNNLLNETNNRLKLMTMKTMTIEKIYNKLTNIIMDYLINDTISLDGTVINGISRPLAFSYIMYRTNDIKASCKEMCEMYNLYFWVFNNFDLNDEVYKKYATQFVEEFDKQTTEI